MGGRGDETEGGDVKRAWTWRERGADAGGPGRLDIIGDLYPGREAGGAVWMLPLSAVTPGGKGRSLRAPIVSKWPPGWAMTLWRRVLEPARTRHSYSTLPCNRSRFRGEGEVS